MARNAFTLAEFVSLDEYLQALEAVVRIFEKADELRKNLAKARLKFLVHRVGIEEFKRMVDEELTGGLGAQGFSPGPAALRPR